MLWPTHGPGHPLEEPVGIATPLRKLVQSCAKHERDSEGGQPSAEGRRVSHHRVARPEGGLHRVAERHDLQEADVLMELELAREEVQAVRVRVLADASVLTTVEQSG